MNIMDSILNHLCGWRKHNSYYINHALSRRDVKDVKLYFNGIDFMLIYKKKRVVFAASHWYTNETYQEYIQRHVDIVLGLRKDPLV